MKVAVPFPYVWPLPCGPHVYLQNCVACSDEDRVHLLLQQTDSQHQLYTAAVHIDTTHALSPVLMFLILSNLFDGKFRRFSPQNNNSLHFYTRLQSCVVNWGVLFTFGPWIVS